MDHDMSAANRCADIQRLVHPMRDDPAHLGVIGGDGKAPERPVDAAAALMAVEKAIHLGRQTGPVAVQNIDLDKMLQLKVARSFFKPVDVRGKALAAQRSAQDRKGHLSVSRVDVRGMLRRAGNRSVHIA